MLGKVAKNDVVPAGLGQTRRDAQGALGAEQETVISALISARARNDRATRGEPIRRLNDRITSP